MLAVGSALLVSHAPSSSSLLTPFASSSSSSFFPSFFPFSLSFTAFCYHFLPPDALAHPPFLFKPILCSLRVSSPFSVRLPPFLSALLCYVHFFPLSTPRPLLSYTVALPLSRVVHANVCVRSCRYGSLCFYPLLPVNCISA